MTVQDWYVRLLTAEAAYEAVFDSGIVALVLWLLFFLGAFIGFALLAARRRVMGGADLAVGVWQAQSAMLCLLCLGPMFVGRSYLNPPPWPAVFEIYHEQLPVLALGWPILGAELLGIQLAFGRGGKRPDWAIGLIVCPLLDLAILMMCLPLIVWPVVCGAR